MEFLRALGFILGVPLGIIIIIASLTTTTTISDFLQAFFLGALILITGITCWILEKESRS